ncbi:Sec14p phosphatidylinositol transfer family protein [Trifolium repens]|nr:Sec14p phosphatidylinositol transfer family protein [Trifolium repens]
MDGNDECNDENGNNNNNNYIPLEFIENLKNLTNKNKDDHDHDCDQELVSDNEGIGFGTQNPVEIKLKIKRSLLEFRCKVEDAILGNYLLGEDEKGEKFAMSKENLREITLWGVPLLPSKSHEGTDIILRKFLKAKDYKVNDAFEMLQKTIVWRIKNNIDKILDEDLGSDFENVGFLNSRDKEGRPVCYHVYDVFKDKVLYRKTFGNQQKCDLFLRWRIQLMETAIKRLCFRGGADGIIQVYDLKNAPIQGMKELNSINKKILMLFQSYYPEIIYKNIVVNAPFWFYTSQVLFSRLMSQRNKSKFIFARPQRVTPILLKFIAPEHLPAEYGGLRRNNDQDFTPDDKVLEHKVRANSISRIEFPVHETGVTIMWDITVVGWDVTYKEEFIPDDEGSYTILLQNQNIVGDSTRNSFYINEPGRILLTIENGNFKKKKMYYRSKTRVTVPMFILLS